MDKHRNTRMRLMHIAAKLETPIVFCLVLHSIALMCHAASGASMMLPISLHVGDQNVSINHPVTRLQCELSDSVEQRANF